MAVSRSRAVGSGSTPEPESEAPAARRSSRRGSRTARGRSARSRSQPRAGRPPADRVEHGQAGSPGCRRRGGRVAARRARSRPPSPACHPAPVSRSISVRAWRRGHRPRRSVGPRRASEPGRLEGLAVVVGQQVRRRQAEVREGEVVVRRRHRRPDARPCGEARSREEKRRRSIARRHGDGKPSRRHASTSLPSITSVALMKTITSSPSFRANRRRWSRDGGDDLVAPPSTTTSAITEPLDTRLTTPGGWLRVVSSISHLACSQFVTSERAYTQSGATIPAWHALSARNCHSSSGSSSVCSTRRRPTGGRSSASSGPTWTSAASGAAHAPSSTARSRRSPRRGSSAPRGARRAPRGRRGRCSPRPQPGAARSQTGSPRRSTTSATCARS